MSKRLYLGLALACQAVLVCDVRGENRFFFEDRTLPAGGTAEDVFLKADADQAILGFSFGVNYDEAAIAVTSVKTDGTLAAVSDFFAGRIDATAGLAGWGCVMDWDDPLTDVIPVGTGHKIAKLVVDVLGASGTSSALLLESVATNPDPARPVKNVMTTAGGVSITTTSVPPLILDPGTITVEDRTPVIVSITENQGAAGKVFVVVGDFFTEPGLTFKVCGVDTDGDIEGDGRTVFVTAPACGTIGFAPVEVCTVRGCDTEANGFEYVDGAKAFVRGNANGDASVDISDGVTILIYLFGGAGTPTCLDAFDANDSGTADISDAIYTFNYLFLGGTPIPPPYPTEGDDPTADALAPCS